MSNSISYVSALSTFLFIVRSERNLKPSCVDIARASSLVTKVTKYKDILLLRFNTLNWIWIKFIILLTMQWNIIGSTSNEDSVEDGKGKKTSFETEMIQIKEDNNETEIINTELS